MVSAMDSINAAPAKAIPRLRPRPHPRRRGGATLDLSRVRAVRVEMDLSQEELAQRAGVTQSLISRIERSAAPYVALSHMLAIASALGTPLTELYELVPRDRRDTGS